MSAGTGVAGFAVEVVDPLDEPAWFGKDAEPPNCCDHYRAALPSRAAGGAYANAVAAAWDGAAPFLLRLADAGGLAVLAAAAEAGCRVRLAGLSRTLNVVRFVEGAGLAFPAFLAALGRAGLPVWLDLDDDPFAVPLEDWEVVNYRWRLGRPLTAAEEAWVRRRAAATNADTRRRLRAVLGAVAGAVVSTAPLAAAVRREAPGLPVRVVANAVDPAPVPPPGARRPGPLRVGCGGTTFTWFLDVDRALPALRAAAERGAEVHCIGGRPDAHPFDALAMPAGRGEWRGLPFVFAPGVEPVPRHLRRLAGLDAERLQPLPLAREVDGTRPARDADGAPGPRALRRRRGWGDGAAR